jgi:hypothetical protein
MFKKGSKVADTENESVTDTEVIDEAAVEPTEEEQLEHDASFDEASSDTENSSEEQQSDNSEEKEEEVNFDKELSAAEREKLKESVFCGPERSYPVPDKTHAVAALSRAKQFASDELYTKIKNCVCRKSTQNGWDLPSCSEDSWSPELIKEAQDKESLIMGWISEDEYNANLQAATAYNEALDKIAKLEEKLNEVLSHVIASSDKKIEEKSETKLADKLQWFDSISNVKENNTNQVSKKNVVIDNPSVASSDDGASPLEGTSVKSLGSFERKIVDKYKQILSSDGEVAAEKYFLSNKQYLARNFHPKNY